MIDFDESLAQASRYQLDNGELGERPKLYEVIRSHMRGDPSVLYRDRS